MTRVAPKQTIGSGYDQGIGPHHCIIDDLLHEIGLCAEQGFVLSDYEPLVYIDLQQTDTGSHQGGRSVHPQVIDRLVGRHGLIPEIRHVIQTSSTDKIQVSIRVGYDQRSCCGTPTNKTHIEPIESIQRGVGA